MLVLFYYETDLMRVSTQPLENKSIRGYNNMLYNVM